jgi:cell division protein FtsB
MSVEHWHSMVVIFAERLTRASCHMSQEGVHSPRRHHQSRRPAADMMLAILLALLLLLLVLAHVIFVEQQVAAAAAQKRQRRQAPRSRLARLAKSTKQLAET